MQRDGKFASATPRRVKNTKRNTSSGIAVGLFIALFSPVTAAQQPGLTASGQPSATTRYGPFGLLDRRSRYGQYWFPEPFRMDETDVDNEIRADWVHLEGAGQNSDNVRAEVEKSFDLFTFEMEVPYLRQTSIQSVISGNRPTRDRIEGIGNVSLGGRFPFFEFVSDSDLFDDTIGAALEVGVPTNSSISRSAELVPKLFNDIRLGDHFSVQTLVGYSFLFGSEPDGGLQTFEYGAVFGYSFDHADLRWPGIERLIPIVELIGDTNINKLEAGHDSLSGTVGIRLNLDSIGPLQPRLGFGYVFPIDQGARDEFRWGLVTSIVFEY